MSTYKRVGVDENDMFPPRVEARLRREFGWKDGPPEGLFHNVVLTGTTRGVTKAMVGLDQADNTSDADKPVSTAVQAALDLKADLTDLDTKANLAGPTFTGTVGGITKAMVGLGNVDNTSDAAKPVSTAVQTALNNITEAVAALPQGIQSFQELVTTTPPKTGLTVILNIPTFTFEANRWYLLELHMSIASTATGVALAQIYSCAVADAATATTGLTELTGFNAPLAIAGGTFRVAAHRLIKFTSRTTVQLKATTSSSFSAFVAAGPTYPTQFTVTDMGAA